ncbi:hypothetical protein U729_3089 (plasmid) [Clostridium baratii str. Sullivan]|uniref:Uncharacterized protein n=1 Tax=Clostridium baratii str. Sullivan TaxID=1415775 RepID=A0A0A7G2I4_9CLOT|nr:hypothetical protein [Clostridium baratii]AIY85250.1 hypothetical protein U729_3089 [Clostridium baratii str. Sullivan]
MNRKQKMVRKMWKSYCHNCKIMNTKPLVNYNVYRNVYIKDSFDYIYKIKEWYKETRIKG